MAQCSEYLELVSAALDGGLSPEEQARLDAHLAACPDCKALYEDLSHIHQGLLDLPPVEVPEGLTERIMDAVAAEAAQPKVVPLPRPKKPAFRWKRWAATAAVLAVALAGMGGSRLLSGRELAPQADKSAIWPQRETLPEVQALPGQEPEAWDARSGDSQGLMKSAAEGPDAPLQDDLSTVTSGLDGLDPSTPAAGDTPLPPPSPEATPVLSLRSSVSPAKTPEPGPAEDLPASSVPSASPEDVAAPNSAQQSSDNTILTMMTSASAVPGAENGLLNAESGEQSPVSEAGDPEETLPMTRQEARTCLANYLWPDGTPEGMLDVDTEEFFGYELPTSGDSPEGVVLDTHLEYMGLTPNGSYHEFRLSSVILDDPEAGQSHISVLNFFAVPVEGGEILVQRQEVDAPFDSAAMEAYQAGIDAYYQAVSN